MSFSFWQSVANTPWWFFAFCIYLFYVAYYATKGHIIPLKMLYLLPIVFIALFVISMFTMTITLANTGIWIGMLCLGMLLGWLQFRFLKVKAIKNENSLYIPGTWSAFIFIFIFLVSQYSPSYRLTFNISQFMHGEYTIYLLCLYGIGLGITLGRLIYSLRCVKVGPFEMNSLPR